ncbi:elongator complex protein 5-like [Physella acuta]|uniref:elongator complex protein 5-like n=1 Tax=Physella acuta TaxID=109671 RepID=UPI0027DBB534|nr:elongator complex protein 5-like [Physella acuta]
MLEDLLNGQEKSACILIKDNTECPGRHLLMNWLISLFKRCEKVILVCFERPADFFINWLPLALQKRIVAIDGNSTIQYGNKADILYETVNNALATIDNQAVVFDALTLHIMLRSAPATCTVLHKLAKSERVSQVLALIHSDLHDQVTCDLLGSIASSVVDLQIGMKSMYTCKVQHCRVTGKVFKTTEKFSIDDQFLINSIGPFVESTTPVQSTSQSDPMADLPFNLSLTETEKEARSQVKLPYVKDGSGDENVTSVGRIIYQPDDADDFDDEDPDDDLNI